MFYCTTLSTTNQTIIWKFRIVAYLYCLLANFHRKIELQYSDYHHCKMGPGTMKSAQILKSPQNTFLKLYLYPTYYLEF